MPDAGLLDDYLDEKQVAQQLRVSVRTVKRWRREGDGPKFVQVGRKLYASKAGVRKWLEDGAAK